MSPQVGSMPKEFQSHLFLFLIKIAELDIKICLIFPASIILIIKEYIGLILAPEALLNNAFPYVQARFNNLVHFLFGVSSLFQMIRLLFCNNARDTFPEDVRVLEIFESVTKTQGQVIDVVLLLMLR
jgi:hypothetical protein